MYLQVFFNTEKHPQLHYNHHLFHIIYTGVWTRCVVYMIENKALKHFFYIGSESSDIVMCLALS